MPPTSDFRGRNQIAPPSRQERRCRGLVVHGIVTPRSRLSYSLMTQPSDFGSGGSVVPPTVTVRPLGPAFATNGRPPVGAVPSPMSSVAVPLRVTEPSGLDVPLVTQPVIVIHWLRPIRLEPFSWTSRSPMADPSLAISAPRPNVPPAISMLLNVAPAGKTPAPPPVTMLSPTIAAA